jgi:hypothetical protein
MPVRPEWEEIKRDLLEEGLEKSDSEGFADNSEEWERLIKLLSGALKRELSPGDIFKSNRLYHDSG